MSNRPHGTAGLPQQAKAVSPPPDGRAGRSRSLVRVPQVCKMLKKAARDSIRR
jgi:hypothetical protein